MRLSAIDLGPEMSSEEVAVDRRESQVRKIGDEKACLRDVMQKRRIDTLCQILTRRNATHDSRGKREMVGTKKQINL